MCMLCIYVCLCVYMCFVYAYVCCVSICVLCEYVMCVVCVVAVWCSGCVLGSRPEVVSSTTFHLVFHLPPTNPFSPPSCVIVGTWNLCASRPILLK